MASTIINSRDVMSLIVDGAVNGVYGGEEIFDKVYWLEGEDCDWFGFLNEDFDMIAFDDFGKAINKHLDKEK